MKVYLLANNVRSTYNVGSLFRLCDGVGVKKLYLTGFTPYPKIENDPRPAYIASKTEKELRKTGLEGISNVPWEHFDNATEVITKLKSEGVKIVAIEQTDHSVNYLKYLRDSRSDIEKSGVCFVVGHERDGVDQEIINQCDAVIEIPMLGLGKSLNVAMAATVMIYSLRNVAG